MAFVRIRAQNAFAMKHRIATAALVTSMLAASTASASPNDLKYYGGRVISNVEIVAVFWGPNVDAMVVSQIGAFYSAIVKSSYIDWLTEYDTIGKVGLVDMMP